MAHDDLQKPQWWMLTATSTSPSFQRSFFPHSSPFVDIFVYLSIYLSISIRLYLSVCLSICLLCCAFPFIRFAEKNPNKEASKQARQQASKQELLSPLDLVCCWGGAAPLPNPPRATKSALHLRHPRLPRNLSLCFSANCTKLL